MKNMVFLKILKVDCKIQVKSMFSPKSSYLEDQYAILFSLPAWPDVSSGIHFDPNCSRGAGRNFHFFLNFFLIFTPHLFHTSPFPSGWQVRNVVVDSCLPEDTGRSYQRGMCRLKWLKPETDGLEVSRRPETPPTTWTMRFSFLGSVFSSFVRFFVR